jgi:DNA-binding NarL/FixJ family response regulator
MTHVIELLKKLKLQAPRLAMLILSRHEESMFAERALRAGALGYLTQREPTANVLKAIKLVVKGEVYLSDRLKDKVLRHLVDGWATREESSLERLSDRELEVFRLIGDGLGTRRIAERLQLSVKTIESYRENLKQKLRFRDGAELVQQAIQWTRNETRERS